jgi:hypothetical protein
VLRCHELLQPGVHALHEQPALGATPERPQQLLRLLELLRHLVTHSVVVRQGRWTAAAERWCLRGEADGGHGSVIVGRKPAGRLDRGNA